MSNDFSGQMFREFANKELTENKKEFQKYCEISRQLNAGKIGLENEPFLIDCLHQPYRSRKEYNHVDAYFIEMFFEDFFRGNILFATLKTEDKAYSDHKKDKNNNSLNSATCIHGKFDHYEAEFWGESEYCDGYLSFKGKVEFIQRKKIVENKQIIIKDFNGLLEVGYCDISTVFAHLFINQGQLARFPYNHNKIGLFLKKNYESSIDISDMFTIV